MNCIIWVRISIVHLLNCVPIASMETVRMLFFMTRRLKVGGKTLRRKISIITSNVPTIGRHEQRRYKLWILKSLLQTTT